MQLIVLSGGYGKRLWPLANDIYTKQFLPIIKNKHTGNNNSLLSSLLEKINNLNKPFDKVVVVGGMVHKDLLNLNVKGRADIIYEPNRQDTFSAIALSCAYLYSEKKVSKNEVVAVTPCDHYVDKSFYETISSVEPFIKNNNYNMVLLGKKITKPSSQYGYIIPGNRVESDLVINDIESFEEKPAIKECTRIINKGGLINCGVFIFRLGYIIDKLEEYLGCEDISYSYVYNNFHRLPKKSFDYEIVEKEKNIAVVSYEDLWSDVGTWPELSKIVSNNDFDNKNCFIDNSCTNSLIINNSSLPLAAIGLKDLIVCASPDGILVSDKDMSPKIKDLLSDFKHRPMYEKKRWGEYYVLDHLVHDDGSEILTKRLTMKAGHSISYQYHNHRKEIWTITNGLGELTLNDEVKRVQAGDVINIDIQDKHALKAISDLEFIEVQLGTPLIEEDIVRLDY